VFILKNLIFLIYKFLKSDSTSPIVNILLSWSAPLAALDVHGAVLSVFVLA